MKAFAELRRRLWHVMFLLGLLSGLIACGEDEPLERVAVQSQDYLRQHLLSEQTCTAPARQWDPRGADVVEHFSSLHATYADGPSLDPAQLQQVRVLRFVSSQEMIAIKGAGDIPLAAVPLGMVRSKSCDKRPFGKQLRWLEMYFLDPELDDHDAENAAIMRNRENRQTVYVHEALHALGYHHFEGNDLSQSLRDGAAGSRFVPTRLRGGAYRDRIGESFLESYLLQVPRGY